AAPREGLPEPRLGLRLDLADALAADPHPLSDLLQGEDLVVLQPEAVGDDDLLLVGEEAQRGLDEAVALVLDELVLRIDRALIDEIVGDGGVLLLADLVVEGDLLETELEYLVDLGDGGVQVVADLLALPLASQLLAKVPLDVTDLLHLLHLVVRDTDQVGLLGQRLEDRLADPPDGVGDELGSLAVIEPVGGLDQPEVPLVEKVLEGQ